MRSVPVGTKGTYEFVVEHNDLAGTVEPSLPPVLATARMSLAMERAAINALKPFLEPGEMTVGAIVSVTHTAATPQDGRCAPKPKSPNVTAAASSSTSARPTKRNRSAQERICEQWSIAPNSTSASPPK